MSPTRDKLFQLQRGLLELEEIIASQKMSVELAQIATQVSHDLRSPLATLLSVAHHTENLDDRTRQEINSVADRIRDIANKLVSRNRPTVVASTCPAPDLAPTPRRVEILSEFLEVLASDMRAHFSHGELEIVAATKGLFGVFVEAGPEVLRALLQSVEAAPVRSGRIELKCELRGRKIHLLQIANGESLSSLDLKLVDAPKWFPQLLEPPTLTVIFDDDPAVHELWRRRLTKYSTTLLHFYTSVEMIAWYRKNFAKLEDVLYLCDYDLEGSRHNGLEVIDMLGICAEAVLVTGRAMDETLRRQCQKKGVRLLPKALVPFIPIKKEMNV